MCVCEENVCVCVSVRGECVCVCERRICVCVSV